MVTSPRTYRPLATVLAFSLLLTVATPLVRHACAMAGAEMATMPCCPPGAHDTPAHPVSDVPPCHDAPAEHEAPAEPCPDASEWSAMRAACYANVEAPAAPALERVELTPADLPMLLAAFVLPPEPPPSPPIVSGDPSPPQPVALHVLYERFLI